MTARDIIKTAFNEFGGCTALTRSLYLKAALIVTIFSWKIWTEGKYWELPISIMPNIIGFTLGGFAILLAFGDTKFMSIISYRSNEMHSPFYKLAVTFLIFILTQASSLIYAIVMKSCFDNPIIIKNIGLELGAILKVLEILLQSFGFILFIYSIFLVIASGVEIFRIVNWLEEYHTRNRERENKKVGE